MGIGGRSVPRGCYRLLTARRNPDTSVGPAVAQPAGGPRAGVSARHAQQPFGAPWALFVDANDVGSSTRTTRPHRT